MQKVKFGPTISVDVVAIRQDLPLAKFLGERRSQSISDMSNLLRYPNTITLGQTCILRAEPYYDAHHSLQYGSAGAKDMLGLDTFFVNLNGNVPCCINSNVPSAKYELFGNGSATVPIGNVLGSCNPTTSEASITWLGKVYAQNISQAQLLTMTVTLLPGIVLILLALLCESLLRVRLSVASSHANAGLPALQEESRDMGLD